MTASGCVTGRDLVVVGAGTYGLVIAELARSCGYRVSGYFDDAPSKDGTTLEGYPVRGPVHERIRDLPPTVAVAVAIGENGVRLALLDELHNWGYETPALVSPHAVVSPTAVLEQGVYLHPGSHVWTHARLGRGSILSPHATVAHHTELGPGCFVSTGANVGASILVGPEAMFGIGSITSTGVKVVARRTLVGAGAVVIRDTEPGGVYVGSPARLLRIRD